jgi:hypothetical protein
MEKQKLVKRGQEIRRLLKQLMVYNSYFHSICAGSVDVQFIIIVTAGRLLMNCFVVCDTPIICPYKTECYYCPRCGLA